MGNTTRYMYDDNMRLTQTLHPLYYKSGKSKTVKAYDECDNVISETDANGNTVVYAYDEFNRLIAVTQTLKVKGSEPVELVTRYTYDLSGNKLTQTNPSGNVWSYVYNICGKVISETEAGRTESYMYDAVGNGVWKRDRNGREHTLEFDVHDRNVEESCDGMVMVEKTFDKNDNLLTMTDSTGTTTYTYDGMNRELTVDAPVVGVVSYEYDEVSTDGRRQNSVTDGKGNVTFKVYDKAGKLTEVLEKTAEATAAVTSAEHEYYDNGRLKEVRYGNGTKEAYIYDANGNLLKLTNYRPDGTVYDVYTYKYDSAGNQISKHEIVRGVDKGRTTYAFDSLNRLQSVNEPDGKRTVYTFDKAGNRRTEVVDFEGAHKVTTYTYDEADRLQNTVAVSGKVTDRVDFTYDGCGNMVGRLCTRKAPRESRIPALTLQLMGSSDKIDKSAVYEYDCFNRMVKSVVDENIVENIYNGLDLRVGKVVKGKKGNRTERYAYDGSDIILTLDKVGAETAHNIRGGRMISRVVSNEKMYYLHNGHGDVVALTDAAGLVVGAYEYDAFGVPKPLTNEKNNPYRYAGYEYDEETNLYYLKSRFYDAELARFISRDTYAGKGEDPLSLNRYAYCANEPLKYKDPSGRNFVSLREIAQTHGAKVSWDNKQKVAYVSYKGVTIYYTGKTGDDGGYFSYRKNKMMVDESQFLRDMRYLKNQVFEKKHFGSILDANGYIVNQYKYFEDNNEKQYVFENMHLGVSTVKDMGCVPISVYNALNALGEKRSLSSIIYFMENHLFSLDSQGADGCWPSAVYLYMSSIPAVSIKSIPIFDKDKVLDYLTDNSVALVCYNHHFVMLRRVSNNSFKVYNMGQQVHQFSNIDDMLNFKERSSDKDKTFHYALVISKNR